MVRKSRVTELTVKKTGPGKYTLFKNGEKVLTALFTRQYRPLPYLPYGYEVTVRIKGRITLRKMVNSIAEGKQLLLQSGRK